MKNTVAIVTDTGCDLTPEQLEQYHIATIPLRMIAGDTEYKDRVNLNEDIMYDLLERNILPKTSLPAPEDIQAVYEDLHRQGYTEAVHVSISSGLSGTIGVVKMVCAECPLKVHVVDSKTLSAGLGMQVMEAARMALKGASASEIVSRLAEMRAKQLGMFVIETLEYLRKGGRIGLVEGAIGQLLHIRPIVFVNDDGIYQALAKARGRKNSIEKMVQAATSRYADTRVRLWVVHGRAQEEAERLLDRLKGMLDIAESYIASVSPVLAVHTGPGLVGVIIAPD